MNNKLLTNLCLLLALSMISISAHGQKKRKRANKRASTTIDNARIDLPEKYRAFSLGFGPRFLSTDSGDIILNFIDDSPAPDAISTTTTLEGSSNSIGVQIGFNFGKYNGISHSIKADISISNNLLGIVTYSLGYSKAASIGTKTLLIRPALAVGFANAGFDLGDLNNDTGFIQFGNNIFAGDKLKATLRSQTFVFGPEIDGLYMISNRIGIYASLAYDFSTDNDNPSLEFTDSDGTIFGTYDIDGDNPDIIYNDEKLTTLPYTVGGMRASIGIYYYWNKY